MKVVYKLIEPPDAFTRRCPASYCQHLGVQASVRCFRHWENIEDLRRHIENMHRGCVLTGWRPDGEHRN
jgi:hypothetical protein